MLINSINSKIHNPVQALLEFAWSEANVVISQNQINEAKRMYLSQKMTLAKQNELGKRKMRNSVS
jgi:hypothetical protein